MRREAYDVLVFGDSLNSVGVVPRAVAERSGRAAYNLSIPGSQATASYFLLKRALGSGAAVGVVDFFPPCSPRAGGSSWRWSSLLTLPEAAELAWWARDADLFGTIAAGCWSPRSARGVGSATTSWPS